MTKAFLCSKFQQTVAVTFDFYNHLLQSEEITCFFVNSISCIDAFFHMVLLPYIEKIDTMTLPLLLPSAKKIQLAGCNTIGLENFEIPQLSHD